MLTDAKVRAAKPRPNSYKLTDAHRLFLLVAPSGGKLWRWNYNYDGKNKTMAFGAYLLNRAGYHGHHVPRGFRAAFSTIMNEWAEREGNRRSISAPMRAKASPIAASDSLRSW